MTSDDHTATEMLRALERLMALKGRTVPAISVDSLGPEDAAFLGRNISKLSPFVSNLLERAVLEELTEVPGDHGFTWQRQDPGFPDAGIFDPSGTFTGAGIEVKAWYALSTEITGRFKFSQLELANRNVQVVLIAWAMSDIVYGQPFILDICMIDAMSVAKARDLHYHRPPHYIVVQHEDNTGRGVQLQQTNVAGYVAQGGASPQQIAEAKALVDGMGVIPMPHDPKTAALASSLRRILTYTLDTNFAKVDRIAHPDIEAFKTRTLETTFRGAKIKGWKKLLSMLDSPTNTKRPIAESAIKQELYGGVTP